MRYQITLAAILTLLAVSNLPAQVGTNLVYNGEFDTPGSNGLDTSHGGQSPNLMRVPRLPLTDGTSGIILMELLQQLR